MSRSLGQNARTRSRRPNGSPARHEWWMVRAGRHDIGVYLDLASSLVIDEAPSVVEQIGRSLDDVRMTTSSQPVGRTALRGMGAAASVRN